MKKSMIFKPAAFIGTLALFLCSFFYAYAQDKAHAIVCGYTDNPNILWHVTYPVCPTHGVLCTEWESGECGCPGGPFYDYCCSIDYFPHVAQDTTAGL